MDLISTGVLLALISGFMNGTFTLPMKYLGRWNWENVWALFIVGSCLVIPFGMALVFAPSALKAFFTLPPFQLSYPVLFGGIWGFGAIMFGQGVSALGISLANTIVLGLSSSLGSLIPLAVLHPDQIPTPKGQTILLGTTIALAGIVLCGQAGRFRELQLGSESVGRGTVGLPRPTFTGLTLCAGAGLLSAVFNIGYALSAPLVQLAQSSGVGPTHASNPVWLLMLGSGSISNLLFCAYLFYKNGSLNLYRRTDGYREYLLCLAMALLWGGHIFIYGASVTYLGALGPSIGWPTTLATGLVTANIWGFYKGEWREADRRTKKRMLLGVAILIVSLVILGKAAHLES